jgi:POT family
LVIPYIQKDPEHYYIGYIVAAAAVFVAAVLFIIGWRYYIHVMPYDTIITMCIPVVINACQTWRRYKMNKRSIRKEQSNSSPMKLIGASHNLREKEQSMRIDERPSTFLDFAKAPNHGKFHDRIVDNVRSLRGPLAVFTLLIPYWLIYDQVK